MPIQSINSTPRHRQRNHTVMNLNSLIKNKTVRYENHKDMKIDGATHIENKNKTPRLTPELSIPLYKTMEKKKT